MENLMLHNGKIATTTMLKEIGFKGYELSRMVANEEIIREKRGIYRSVTTDYWETSDLHLVIATVPEAIYCMISALCLHKYLPDKYFRFEISVPRSLSPSKRKIQDIDARYYYVNDSIHQLGKTYCDGIPVYDKERTVCDWFKHHTRTPDELLELISKKYLSDPDKNIDKLTAYAEQMHLSVAAMKKMNNLILKQQKTNDM